MSSLRNRLHRLGSLNRAKSIAFLSVVALLVSPFGVTEAGATGAQATVGMYLDQPFVQGSYVAEDYPSETSVTTFNEQNYWDTCSFAGATIEALYAGAPDCHVQTEINYGGASTTSSAPVVGQYPAPVNYGQVGSGGASIVFNTPQTYFGMWWSAGSSGNEVQLFSGTDLVANTSANDVASALLYTPSITSLNGDQYASNLYIGNPVDWYTVGTPYDFSGQDPDNSYQSNHSMAQEPFVYIHFLAAPGTTFDRVNLIAPGNGFEFDNFTTSTSTSISAPSRLVLQRQLYQPTYVDFDANGGSGALPRQYSVDSNPGYLQSNCLDYEDPTRCISAPNNSYATQFLGWNTAADGSGDAYYFENWIPFPFTESTTLYAQWKNQFYFYYMTNPNADGSNIWDYYDWSSESLVSTSNFADLTLPAPERAGQYLEGWYTFDSNWNLVRVGGPGEAITASAYTTWDSNVFGRWLDNPPAAVDALTPEVLLVYPQSQSVSLPNLPLIGADAASVCLVESDESGNQISSSLQFTDLSTASSGYSSGFLVSDSAPIVTSTHRYIRITVSPSSDPYCSSGNAHLVEIRPLEATRTSIFPVSLLDH